jgi:hypothetical protein
MGINVRPHLYFQWLGRSKNDTPHNLDVNSSMLFESHGQTDLWRPESPGTLSRNCFGLLVKTITAFVTVRASRCWDLAAN